MVRAVLDTNIIVRGLLRRKTSAAVRVYDLFLRGHFACVSSPQLLDEVRTTLAGREIAGLHLLGRNEIEAFLSLLADTADVTSGVFIEVDKVPTDVKDNPLLAAALEGAASYIVTEDKRDLLPLKDILVAGFEPIHVMAPGPFLRALGPR